MVLIHALGAAAGMIQVKCPRCAEAQSKMRSKSGRYVCKRCHHAFTSGNPRKSSLKHNGRR